MINQSIRLSRRSSILAVTVLLLAGVYFVHLVWVSNRSDESSNASVPKGPSEDTPIRTVFFYEPNRFPQVVAAYPRSGNAKSRGIVVPHHLLASPLIAETLAQVANYDIDRIVLIGPNHFERGEAPVITSDVSWESPQGIVHADKAIVRLIAESLPYVAFDDQVLEKEHSLSSIMPFLSHYLPGVPVVPLAISMKLTQEDLDNFQSILTALDTGATLYIASVDFSHYLLLAEARARDEITQRLILEKNTEALLELSSQYIDSPRSLVLLIGIMEKLGYPSPVIVKRMNSSDFINDYNGEVTTYFSIHFEKI